MADLAPRSRGNRMPPLETPPPHLGLDGFLSAQDPRPEALHALRGWLLLQASLCLSPTRAMECLSASSGDPHEALKISRQSHGASREQLNDWIQKLAKRQIRILPVTSVAYPLSLRTLPDPPPVLMVRGQNFETHRPLVAIVGARAASQYGLAVAESLGRGLAAAGVIVVSGLARGIDGAAHRGALDAGSTWAVLGCGLDVTYPREHSRLADRIAMEGSLVSELPLGHPPAALHFPLRNRIISGLVQSVIVVEARPRSGSLITARHALSQGREVLVVPGDIDSPTSKGTNALLRDGAKPVLNVQDVLETLSLPELKTSFPKAPSPESETSSPTDPNQKKILHVLRHESLDRDALQRRLTVPARMLALHLVELEIAGWICQERNGQFRIAPARSLRQ